MSDIMDSLTLKKMKETVEKLKVVKRELVSSYEEGYIGKRVYRITLADGTSRMCEQITKNKRNGDAVIILPITTDDKFVMILESRPNTEESVVAEFPAGMVDPGEEPIVSAKRELLEETGYEADELYELECHYQDQGCSKAKIRIYVALGCKKKQEQRLEDAEKIECFPMTYEEILEMLRGESEVPAQILDSGSKLAFMTYTLKKKGIL